MLVQPLRVDITELKKDTHKYFEAVVSAVRIGLNTHCESRYPEFYKRRKHILLHPEGSLCYNDLQY